MAPHIWASDPQLAFLKSRLPNFVTAQAAGQLAAFWPNLQERWFHNFPEEVAQGLPPPNALGDAPALTMPQMEALGAAIKRRKSAQPSVPTDALPDIALAAADTLPGSRLQLASLL
ncbi:hypothetical protein C8J57DRAFT_1494234 [Mycena rebaudengoi]|nr:hypothetical protein C8J57DRAFT_1494234 [Mycena rebaudengoi]